MTRSWKEKLDNAGVRFVEASAKARQVKPPASLDFAEIARWLREQRTVWSALEADRNLRIEVYVTIAQEMVLLRRAFSEALKRQLGSKVPERKELVPGLRVTTTESRI